MSIGFRFFAQQDANACAVLDPSGRHWTRGELERLANQTARALRDLGLKEGDAIALVSRNRVEYLIVFLAALRSGLHLVPINWHLAGAEIAYLLKDSRAQALLADSRLRALVSDALLFEPQSIPFLLSFGSMAGFRDFWDVIDSYSAESLEPGVAGQLLQYASATTWRPKGVLVPPTSPDLLRRTIDMQVSMGVGMDDGTVHLGLAPLYHSAAIAIVSTALDMGHTVHLADESEPETCLRCVHMHGAVTSFIDGTLCSPQQWLLAGSRRSLPT